MPPTLIVCLGLLGCASTATKQAAFHEARNAYIDLACRRDEFGRAAPPTKAEPASSAGTTEGYPETAGQMTEAAGRAKRLFDAEQFAAALPALEAVARGDTGDDAGNRQIAQYHVAIVNTKLGAFERAVEVFAAISDDPRHLKFNETLLWIATIALTPAAKSDTRDRALDLVGRYDDEHTTKFRNPDPGGEGRDRRLFLRGRLAWRRGDAVGARRFLAQVNPDGHLGAPASECLALIRERMGIR